MKLKTILKTIMENDDTFYSKLNRELNSVKTKLGNSLSDSVKSALLDFNDLMKNLYHTHLTARLRTVLIYLFLYKQAKNKKSKLSEEHKKALIDFIEQDNDISIKLKKEILDVEQKIKKAIKDSEINYTTLHKFISYVWKGNFNASSKDLYMIICPDFAGCGKNKLSDISSSDETLEVKDLVIKKPLRPPLFRNKKDLNDIEDVINSNKKNVVKYFNSFANKAEDGNIKKIYNNIIELINSGETSKAAKLIKSSTLEN